MLLGVSMAVENSKVGPIEEMAQSWQDEIEGRVKGLQTGSYARILKMAKKPLPSCTLQGKNPPPCLNHMAQWHLKSTPPDPFCHEAFQIHRRDCRPHGLGAFALRSFSPNHVATRRDHVGGIRPSYGNKHPLGIALGS